jgi:hypothetical protein
MTAHADPDNRCQRTGTFGQCPDEKVSGTDFCARHGGNAVAKRQVQRMYDLAQAEMKGLYGSMSDREDILSLRAEVALIRAAIQKFSNLMGQSDTSFESKINTFNNLLLTAKALIGECVKVEKSAGLTVDRAALLQFAAAVIQICGEEIAEMPESQAVLERIAARIIDAVKSAGETENEAE